MGKISKWIPKPRHWWRSLDHTSRQILLVLIGVAVIFSVPTAVLSGDWSGLLLNLGTELAGGAVTFILLDEILGGRRRKAELIREMASTDNGIALRAVSELRAHGWLTDGSLKGANLRLANLQGADLQQANLQGVDLTGANLKNAILFSANFQDARPLLADFQGAYLASANFQGAWFGDANLQGAVLEMSVQMGMDGPRELWQVKFDETTLLPDDALWKPDTDITRFTDPDHPDFWRSDNDRSPAYQDRSD